MLKFTPISLAILFLFHSQTAHAQAQPVPSKMQMAIGEAILNYAGMRGFAANDPRVYKTLYAVGQVAKTTAQYATVAAVGTAVVGTSPGWASVLATAAIGAGLTYAIPITIDSFVRWKFDDSGEPIQVINPLTGTSQSLYSQNGLSVEAGTCSQTINISNHCIPAGFTGVSSFTACMAPMQQNPTNACLEDGNNKTFEQLMAEGGFTLVPPKTTTTSEPQTVGEAVASLTPEQLAQPVSPGVIAKTAELLLNMAAALPGYEGIPAPAPNTLTPEIAVPPAAAASPNYPPVADFVQPQNDLETDFAPAKTSTSSATGSVPQGTTANTANDPDAINAPEGATKVDLGADPGINAPTLEQTPTAEMILAPILNLMPSLKNYVVPSHAGTCPRPEFNVFNQQIVMSSHCDLLEPNRALIHSVMLAAFGIAAAVIVLKA